MIGIYKIVLEPKPLVVSDNFETAVKALYDKYATDDEKMYYSPVVWWKFYKQEYRACHIVKEK